MPRYINTFQLRPIHTWSKVYYTDSKIMYKQINLWAQNQPIAYKLHGTEFHEQCRKSEYLKLKGSNGYTHTPQLALCTQQSGVHRDWCAYSQPDNDLLCNQVTRSVYLPLFSCLQLCIQMYEHQKWYKYRSDNMGIEACCQNQHCLTQNTTVYNKYTALQCIKINTKQSLQ